ncbi:DUF6683 family protein [Conexibacter woesei]|uniref:Uncharacterized protein n=1 Tax=Conexibacter woesei (strain DSM 14684 / CCUG 47730 / CIP 108061 / JCM 11494 / NBRC 100937 / ID131577) TaxID=469383 RepID=D3F9T3_CONWI|nr:DUF6683 family protein [Conexibacter woesei]ADB51145.1 hypothetical protein Cwoe_2726 [Conexibacter woesei DSM 14684]
MKRSKTVVAVAVAAMAAVPGVAQADIYNPTTAEHIPTSYYYPAPAPTIDPPPMTFPPLDLTSPSPSDRSSPSAPRRDPVLGYRPSARVSKEGNRQLAALFAKRLGRRNVDRRRFLAEADKGTFRKAFAELIGPLGWSTTDFGDALAAYTVSSYMIANDIGELSGTERIGAQTIEQDLRARLRTNPAMKRSSARSKQLATERLNTITIVQIVQYANGDESARATQSDATRQAGLKTFGGDLTRVQLGNDGFEPRDG